MIKEPTRGTDNWLILEVLKDKEPHHIIEISKEGFPGCINVAIRSRISNLREMGYNIINLRDSTQNRDNIPIPCEILDLYGSKDRGGVYLLAPPPKPAVVNPTIEETDCRGDCKGQLELIK